MSQPIDVLFEQRLFKCAGFYKGLLDGKWGKQTDDAQAMWDQSFADTAKQYGVFDPRTEGNLRLLLPKMQVKARQLMAIVHASPVGVVRIISGTRTYAEQDRLFAQTNPRVTRARGGQSNHNFGIAVDIGIFANGVYLNGDTPAEQQAYRQISDIIKGQVSGLKWGGDWSGFVDQPHYEMDLPYGLSVLRMKFEAGQPFV